MKLPSDKCFKSSLLIDHHWCRQQAIIWARYLGKACCLTSNLTPQFLLLPPPPLQLNLPSSHIKPIISGYQKKFGNFLFKLLFRQDGTGRLSDPRQFPVMIWITMIWIKFGALLQTFKSINSLNSLAPGYATCMVSLNMVNTWSGKSFSPSLEPI